MHDFSPENLDNASLEEQFLALYRQVDLDARRSAEQVFESIVQSLETPARALIQKMIGKSQLFSHEDDLLNFLWMALWQNAHIPSRRWKQGDASALTLAMTILKYKILDLERKHYRELKVRYLPTAEKGNSVAFPDIAESALPPLEQLVRNERDEITRQVIKKLPRKFAKLMWNKHIKHMKSREIALLTNTSQGTVSKRLAEGESLLKKALAQRDLLRE